MSEAKKMSLAALLFFAAFVALDVPVAKADAVTEWNARACELASPASFDTPTANRMIAIMHTAIYEAVNAITKKYPAGDVKLEAANDASVDAAVAAAAHGTLVKLMPLKQQEVDAAYQASLAKITESKSKTDGINVGEKAAAAILAACDNDGFGTIETYRPYTIAGVYVPTVIPLASQWVQRRPWLMSSASQFRPGPPPDLKSEIWTRDYNEIKSIGRKENSKRTTDQTDMARFWEATGPTIYHGVIRSVADRPGRDITRNARFLMAMTQAMDDAIIAVFDAKYHYNFWRPITAIRNGDIDGNDATERDASWTPLISTPMHPEYPCAHCIVSGTVGTVIRAEIGSDPMPVLATTSPAANDLKRMWTKVEDFMQEVANGRIYDGVHFRTSTEVGTAMGRKVGKLAAAKYLQPIK
ncbi:MAG: vanadium-dependent haloperoxidase [Pyrinomonadaceae bacterium]